VYRRSPRLKLILLELMVAYDDESGRARAICPGGTHNSYFVFRFRRRKNMGALMTRGVSRDKVYFISALWFKYVRLDSASKDGVPSRIGV